MGDLIVKCPRAGIKNLIRVVGGHSGLNLLNYARKFDFYKKKYL